MKDEPRREYCVWMTPPYSALETQLAEVMRDCTEIVLQTYGRKPSEMTETSQHWKLARAEEMVRGIRAKLSALSSQIGDRKEALEE